MYGSSREIDHIIVCHTLQNKYVFDYEIGNIENGIIRKSGTFTSSLGSSKKIDYNFEMHISDYEYDCDDLYCFLNDMDVKHFHARPSMMICDNEKIHDSLAIIEYDDVPVLENYKKFFSLAVSLNTKHN